MSDTPLECGDLSSLSLVAQKPKAKAVTSPRTPKRIGHQNTDLSAFEKTGIIIVRENSTKLAIYWTENRGHMKHSEGFLKLVNDSKGRIREVTVAETRSRMTENPDARLIDVREDNEWEASHAAGAMHLGKGIIERDIESAVPDKTAELILYCGGGYRSALAADVLQQMGYTNVFSMAGGWKAWKESGGPVEE